MESKPKRARKCKRCKELIEEGKFCQQCKNALVAHYEVTLDWQMAYDIEKAQQYASRYSFTMQERDEPF